MARNGSTKPRAKRTQRLHKEAQQAQKRQDRRRRPKAMRLEAAFVAGSPREASMFMTRPPMPTRTPSFTSATTCFTPSNPIMTDNQARGTCTASTLLPKAITRQATTTPANPRKEPLAAASVHLLVDTTGGDDATEVAKRPADASGGAPRSWAMVVSGGGAPANTPSADAPALDDASLEAPPTTEPAADADADLGQSSAEPAGNAAPPCDQKNKPSKMRRLAGKIAAKLGALLRCGLGGCGAAPQVLM